MKKMRIQSIKVSKWLGIVGAALLSTSINADTLDDKRLNLVKRDIKIMTNIVKTAVNDAIGRSGQVEGIYLADQGMMFTLRQGGFVFEFGDMLSHIPVAPMPPKPIKPVVASNSGMSIEFAPETVEAIEEYAMEAAEAAMELAEVQIDMVSDMDWSGVSNQERNKLRAENQELRNQRRELEREARKLERDVREIERKIRDAEFQQEIEADKSNAERIQRWEEELKGLTGSLQGVASKIKEKADVLQQKSATMLKERQEQQLEEQKKVAMAISQSVCDFGGGLRSLKDDQHLTFNIKGKSNLMYVFSSKNIEKCADGDLNAEKLLEKATTYSM
jgi:hypothetical protein